MFAARSTLRLSAASLEVLSLQSRTHRAAPLPRRAHNRTTTMAQSANLTLYTAGTPNGWKPSITLEEMGLPYKVEAIDIGSNRQKEPWYLKINPNGRIPALIDHDEGDLNVWESGSIMIYLADKFGAEELLPKSLKSRTDVISWLMFQMGGIGPMQGQANHFFKAAPEEGRTEYAQQRYLNETKRLYQVLEDRLKDPDSKGWLALGRLTLADIANFSWVAASKLLDQLDLNEFPAVKAWHDKMLARPAVRKGLDVPTKNKFL